MHPDRAPALPPGVRVLVVEDDFMVARSLEFLLRANGFDVVGMAASVEAALRFTDRVPFDVAILDVNLRGGTVARFADKLVELGRPFIFLTGYGDLELLEEHLRDRPRLDKPVDPEVLITTMADLLAVSEPP